MDRISTGERGLIPSSSALMEWKRARGLIDIHVGELGFLAGILRPKRHAWQAREFATDSIRINIHKWSISASKSVLVL